MTSPDLPFSPSDYPQVRIVDSFEALVATPFRDGVNALCWRRSIVGDFGEVVAALGACEGMDSLDEGMLRGLDLSPAGKAAVEVLVADLALLEERGLAPVLNRIAAYPREEEATLVPTDVYSFHADSATVEADTYLCTYFGASSDALRSEDAVRCVEIPEMRTALLAEYGGADDEGFRAYLEENFYHLHYVAKAGARPVSFGIGHLWRIATEWPGSPVPPCVHRAPENLPGTPPRLLLIS